MGDAAERDFVNGLEREDELSSEKVIVMNVFPKEERKEGVEQPKKVLETKKKEVIEGFYIGQSNYKKFVINPNTLVNHVVVLGATGSGKTVLCKNIIEQAVMNKVPILIIDPKGDIGTIGIANEEFEFRPYSDVEAAVNKKDPEEYARELKNDYAKKLKNAGINSEIIRDYINKLDLRLYTPKNVAGLKISISPSFEVPENFKERYEEDPVAFNELIEGIALSILKICGFNLKKTQKEHALITQIIIYEWKHNRNIDIQRIIHLVKDPPFGQIGGLLINEFLSDKKRMDLASTLNLLLSKPSLKYWMEGDIIDFDEFFKQQPDKVRVNVIDLRWISNEFEKQFFLEMLLQTFYQWLIKQSGTNKLKYLFYFDELKGYLPSYPQNPPSKKFLELLIKQGRAFGLGCIFATQNPGDIDYKIIGNIRTRFIGNLKTDRDIRKIAEGMDLSFNQLSSMIITLNQGEFVYNDSLINRTQVIKTKWLMSYHRGPLMASEIKKLMDEIRGRKERKLKEVIEEEKIKKEEKKIKAMRVYKKRIEEDKKITKKKKVKHHKQIKPKKLITKCPSCGFRVYPGEKFCGNCGRKIR